MESCMIENLSKFEYNIEGPAFRYLFVKKAGGTNHMANHLWGKFHDKNHSVLALWGSLDSENRRRLVKVIDEYPESERDLPWKEIRKFDEENPRSD